MKVWKWRVGAQRWDLIDGRKTEQKWFIIRNQMRSLIFYIIS